MARDVLGSLVLGVLLCGAPELHLYDEDRGDILAGPEGVDQRNDLDFLTVLPALITDTLLPQRTADIAAGSANGTAIIVDALLSQAALVAANAFLWTAAVINAPRLVRAAPAKADALLHAARVAQACSVFVAAGISTLPGNWAAGFIAARLACFAAHSTADLR